MSRTVYVENAIAIEQVTGVDNLMECVGKSLLRIDGVTVEREHFHYGEYFYEGRRVADIGNYWDAFGDGDGDTVEFIDMEPKFMRDIRGQLLPMISEEYAPGDSPVFDSYLNEWFDLSNS